MPTCAASLKNTTAAIFHQLVGEAVPVKEPHKACWVKVKSEKRWEQTLPGLWSGRKSARLSPCLCVCFTKRGPYEHGSHVSGRVSESTAMPNRAAGSGFSAGLWLGNVLGFCQQICITWRQHWPYLTVLIKVSALNSSVHDWHERFWCNASTQRITNIVWKSFKSRESVSLSIRYCSFIINTYIYNCRFNSNKKCVCVHKCCVSPAKYRYDTIRIRIRDCTII